MSAIPPIAEVCDALVFAVLPAIGVTALVAALIPAFLGPRTKFIAAAIAFVAGVAAANVFRGCLVFRLESDLPLYAADLIRSLWSAIAGQRAIIGGTDSDPIYAPRAGRYWLPWASLLALAGGLLIHLAQRHPAVSYTTRILTSVLAARLIVPATLAIETPWLAWVVALVIYALWTLAECRSERIPNEVTSAAVGLASVGAAAILLHAHSARLTDVATLIAFASFGITAIAFLGRIDAAGAIPAMAVALPGVLVAGYHETFSAVPAIAFLLPALAPLATALLSFMPERFVKGWRLWAIAALLVGAPTFAAVVLAARAEPLQFEASNGHFTPLVPRSSSSVMSFNAPQRNPNCDFETTRPSSKTRSMNDPSELSQNICRRSTTLPSTCSTSVFPCRPFEPNIVTQL